MCSLLDTHTAFLESFLLFVCFLSLRSTERSERKRITFYNHRRRPQPRTPVCVLVPGVVCTFVCKQWCRVSFAESQIRSVIISHLFISLFLSLSLFRHQDKTSTTRRNPHRLATVSSNIDCTFLCLYDTQFHPKQKKKTKCVVHLLLSF